MYKFLTAFCILILCGCASKPLTEEQIEEREWNRAMDRENWALCEQLYKQAGKPTYHIDHSHSKGVGKSRNRHWWIESDLLTNQCRRVLRDEWLEDY
jgi:hypothetical protein